MYIPLLLPLIIPTAAWAAVSFTGATYTQNFDTLANTGTTNTTLPSYWQMSESGSSANTTYSVGTGSLTTGNTYSFGTASSIERAFGGLQSGTLIPTIGASFQNDTGGTLTALTIQYTGEQWRLGATGRTDRLDFQYSTDATSLTIGTWTNVDALDFTAPVTSGTVGALDGNATANKTVIIANIAGLSIISGSTFWIRWTDFNPSGADDGLSIDDFSLSAITVTKNQWTLIGLPYSGTTVASAFGDDGMGDYNTQWEIYRRDEVTKDYIKLNLGDNLVQDYGYWLISKFADTAYLNVDGNATPVLTTGDCADTSIFPKGCFSVSLTHSGTRGQYNLVSYPFTDPLAWSRVRFASGGVLRTPIAAESATIASKTMWKYGTGSYGVYDDVTPGMIGTLQPMEGFWVKALASGVTLLIPKP